MQKHRDREGKSTRYFPPSSSEISSKTKVKTTFVMKFSVLISVDSDSSSHHENRHASEDPNTTNLFINTIPRAVRREMFFYRKSNSIDRDIFR